MPFLCIFAIYFGIDSKKLCDEREPVEKSIFADVRVITKIVSTNTQWQKMQIVQAKVTKWAGLLMKQTPKHFLINIQVVCSKVELYVLQVTLKYIRSAQKHHLGSVVCLIEPSTLSFLLNSNKQVSSYWLTALNQPDSKNHSVTLSAVFSHSDVTSFLLDIHVLHYQDSIKTKSMCYALKLKLHRF